MSEQDYVKQQLTKLQQTVNAAQTAHPLAADSIEHYVAYEAANSCNKCHGPGGIKLPSDVLAALKVRQVQLLSTVPTGIPETVRGGGSRIARLITTPIVTRVASRVTRTSWIRLFAG